MSDHQDMTPAQIRRAAMDAVVREVGVVGLIRLLRDEVPGSGNYVLDREALLPHFDSVEAMMKAMAEGGAPESGERPS